MDNLDAEAVDSRPTRSLYQVWLTTFCMVGIQFTWTVELSYGTPYLLSLELPKELIALVWLAAPLSGLIVQPLVGVWSDKYTSRLGRRRPFILGGGVIVCLSLLFVAHSKDIASGLASDPDLRRKMTIGIAVSAFYILDFSINAVQASCRSLILDAFPVSQQDTANAFASNTQNITNVFGYFIGFADLVKYVPLLGGAQMEAFCTAGVVVFVCAMSVTCFTTKEVPYQKTQYEESEPWYYMLTHIWDAFRRLPSAVQKLCNVQFFAWMGWFPFLFYSTTWVSDIYFETHEKDDPDAWEKGTRAGSFALMLYAIVAVVGGTVLPTLTANGIISLRNTYTLSHIIFATSMLSTPFVRSVTGATLVFSLLGISFACTHWIPFALIGEYLIIHNNEQSIDQRNKSDYGATSSASIEDEEQKKNPGFDVGLVLGVHNMYVVFPQFAMSIISAIIFAISDSLQSSNAVGVTWVLRFGGLMAVVAAVLSRKVVDVKTKLR